MILLFFANESQSSLKLLMDFLYCYVAILEQLISQANNYFYVTASIHALQQVIVHFVTSFQQRQLSFTYLEWSVYMRCLKIAYFDDMVWKYRDKISSYANILLSFDGKLMLICHVLSSMHIHLFHVLRTPAVVIQYLVKHFTRF